MSYDPYNHNYGSSGQGGYGAAQGGNGGGYGQNQFGAYSAQDLHPASSTTNFGARGWDSGGDGAYAPIGGASGMGNAPRNSVWLEKQQARSKRSRWIIIGVLVLVVLAAVGAGVGITLSKHHTNNAAATGTSGGTSSSDNSSGSSSSNSSSNSSVTGSNPNDPSQFTLNPAFKKVFYGMAYTPDGSILPNCGANQAAVTQDIQLMSQMTDTIRLYGSDCNITALVLQAIQDTKVKMNVYIGNFIDITDDTVYQRQKTTIEAALKTYGASNVLGVTVGNEAILNACTDANVQDPNDPAIAPAAAYVVKSIQDTRSGLAAMGLSAVKVGNSDAGSYFNTQVLSAVDYAMANVHPWFAQTTITDAVSWTWEFFQDTNVAAGAALANNPEMFIAETGWPSGSKWANTSNDGAGVGGEASIANVQTFLENFVCQSNTKGIKYFWFELFDEVWKDIMFGGVEGYWGLLNSNRTLKDGLTFPDCVIS